MKKWVYEKPELLTSHPGYLVWGNDSECTAPPAEDPGELCNGVETMQF